MPERRLIHVDDDLNHVCKYVGSIGMIVFLNERQATPAIAPLDLSREIEFQRGVYSILRPEWVFSELKFNFHEAGFLPAGYTVKHVNMISIQLSVHGESQVNGVRRLGSGSFSFRPNWYDEDARVSHHTSTEVADAYKAIMKKFLSNKFVKGGIEKYNLTRLALEAIEHELTLPPFDHISWPPKLPNKRGKLLF
jgi:hypothetical protein